MNLHPFPIKRNFTRYSAADMLKNEPGRLLCARVPETKMPCVLTSFLFAQDGSQGTYRAPSFPTAIVSGGLLFDKIILT